jgi:chemotaxis protein histidine kinase CheA
VGVAASSVLNGTEPAFAFGEAAALEAQQPPPARKARRHAAKSAPARETKRAEAPNPDRPLFAVISLGNQHISIYNHHGLVERSAVSTGKPGHPTPEGVFTIIGRERFHRSNLYSGAPMPFMQRITWSGVAMHLGVVPGHPASHGCIRLPGGFAAKLWGLTRIGERVVIAPHDVTPSEFSHPLLPSPKMQLVAEKPAAEPAAGEAKAEAAEPPALNPRKYADQLVAKAAADTAAAIKAAKEADAAIAPARQENVKAATELRAAETAHAVAQAKAEAAARAFDAARLVVERQAVASATPEAAAVASSGKSDGAKEAAAAAKSAADEALASAAGRLEQAKAASAAKTAEFSDTVRRAKEAAEASSVAVRAEKDARLRTAPISVLISKKDRKIYVRQGLTPLFDAPANVRDPEVPLGSHLFIATAAKSDGKDLDWSVLSLPPRVAEARNERRKKGSGLFEERSASAPLRGSSSGPAEALERIEIAQEVRDRIAERLWLGGSLIISDQPPSVETGAVGTDLTVKLR